MGAVLAGTARADRRPELRRWDLELAWWNDFFSELPPVDDAGFTNDTVAALRWRLAPDRALRVAAVHRMVTERWGRRRWDQLDLAGAYERRWPLGRFVAQVEGRGGLVVAGNLGGLALQDGWHRWTGTGPTVDEGLPDRYDGERRAAALIGARAELEWPAQWARPYGGLDGALALGSTGVSSFAAFAGVAAALPLGREVELVAWFELAAGRYATGDPNLAMPGGYGTDGWQASPRLGAALRGRAWQLAWEWRGNEGGSGEPTGVVAFTVRR